MKIELPDFSKARVLVVGDVMLDRYWSGGTERISPEAPVPVMHVRSMEECPGGAGNVALNVAALEGHVSLLGVTGKDITAELLEARLEQSGIQVKLQRVPGVPTVTKVRILSKEQQLIRLDFEERIDAIDYDSLLSDYKTMLDEVDVVLLSDYNKGTLSRVQALIQAAKTANKIVLVDPKRDDFSVYKGADLLTPNLKEFINAVGPCDSQDEIVEKGLKLIKDCKFGSLLVTLGKQGMLLLEPGAEPVHLESQAHEVYDVTGAGDTVIAVLASAVAAGADLQTATYLANTAAGITVTKLGAATVRVPEIRRAIYNNMHEGQAILDEELAVVLTADAKAHHERVVMTNGCFDLLHPGHLAYLNAARSLGDRLIVAVNDDNSVRRLKGEKRPVNTLEYRMTMLANLSCVDWVVPFSEDTPERIITRILPDVLVKGGDYTVDQIAGASAVLEHGGQVKVLDFLPGYSTTELIKQIKSV